MDRKVTGQVLLPNNTPYTNLTVLFRLRYGEYMAQGLVPRGDRTVKTDVNGRFEIILWCNEPGFPPPTYSVAIGNRMFDFRLYPGTPPFNLLEERHQHSEGESIVSEMGLEARQMLAAIANQTVFQLNYACSDPEQSFLAINGVQARYGIDYQISGNTLVWQGGYALDEQDAIEIVYPY